MVSFLATCSKDNLELFIVLDSSRTLLDHQYEEFKDFLANLMSHFNIGKFRSRVGLMQFSDTSRVVVEFSLGKHTTTKSIQDNINRLVHQQGNATNLGSAFEMINKKVTLYICCRFASSLSKGLAVTERGGMK